MAPGRRRPAVGRISAEHKEALAEGRANGRIVRRYVEALAARPPQPPSRRTDNVDERIAAIEIELKSADPMGRVLLSQERIRLRALAKSQADADAFLELEKEFIRVARAYSERKEISFEAWREGGVSVAVLRRAGLKPSS